MLYLKIKRYLGVLVGNWIFQYYIHVKVIIVVSEVNKFKRERNAQKYLEIANNLNMNSERE